MSTRSYAADWTEALDRSARFGLKVPEMVAPGEERYLTSQRQAEFPYVIRRALGDLTVDDLVCQCMAINIRLRAVLQEWLGCEVYYTIGWVDTDAGAPLFQFDDAFIAEKLANGHPGGEIGLHAWVTLPSLEVIDVSLATSFAVLQNRKDGHGGVIASHPDTLRGFAYRPMLVGDDFLRKTGILIEGSFLTIERS
ncbi:hypothetical protein [Achromobacter sp. DH1f]|uniref:hypothetical protein n=1 Tax=Achromobacter sp. DH1f TaxID=1397275 RepID=UPI000468C7A8|nr:hypothetical protein [Achromobacter sp. DH1f]